MVIGAYFSDRKEMQPNLGIVDRDPQVMHRTDKVMQLMEGWETVCGTVLGTGQEEYMTIGGFNGSRDIEEVKGQESRASISVACRPCTHTTTSTT